MTPTTVPTAAQAKKAAAFLRSCGHPARLRILCLLHGAPATVGTLTEKLGLPQPTTSQLLARLKKEGLIKGTRHGKTIRYSLTAPLVAPLLGLLHGHFCATRRN